MLQPQIYAAKFGVRPFAQISGVTRRIVNDQQLRQQTTAAKVQTNKAEEEWGNARPFEELPRPTMFQMIKNSLPGNKYYRADTPEVLKFLREDYGDILVIPAMLGKPPVVLTCNPHDYGIVFRNEGVWPYRIGAETMSYHRNKLRADFFNGVEGLITSQGEAWGSFRSKVNPVMLQPKNVRLYLQKMSAVTKQFIDVMRKLRDAKTNELPEDFETYINRWALESVCIVALDKQLGLLTESTVDPMIQRLFDSITDFMTLCNELDNKTSLWKYVATPGYKRLMRAYDGIMEVTSHYVNEAVQELEEAKRKGIEKPEHEKSVLEKLLKIDQKVAIVMAMDMLMAGVDTTTSTFTGVLLCLAQNPEKQAKLREELRRILPEKDSEFTEASLNDMSYLRACLKESLRVYPLVDGSARQVQNDVVLSGYRIPKGNIVAMMLTGLNKDAKYYARPNEYLPERWLRTPKQGDAKACPNDLKLSNPFVNIPFGFGPRSCVGRRIAELELEVGIARVIRNFSVTYNYSTEKPFKTLLVNVPNIPLKFELTDVGS